MPTIIPFKAFRPQPELVTRVASPPYDVLNSEEARQLVERKGSNRIGGLCFY